MSSVRHRKKPGSVALGADDVEPVTTRQTGHTPRPPHRKAAEHLVAGALHVGSGTLVAELRLVACGRYDAVAFGGRTRETRPLLDCAQAPLVKKQVEARSPGGDHLGDRHQEPWIGPPTQADYGGEERYDRCRHG